jgi:muramoyltetrapeptide carboxypeptidase
MAGSEYFATMIEIPPYLKHGDTIGIVCPAGYMASEKVRTCIDTIQEWGYRVKVGKTVGGDSATYFSGTDDERLADFQQMMDDDDVQAVLCGRGGYGMGRIIERIRFKKFRKHPKWIAGYSDITVLHAHVYSNYGISTIHSPMAAAFNDEGYRNQYVLSLKHTLEGKPMDYACTGHEFNRPGEASGELVGGNLALLAHLTGTGSDIKTKNRLLFIEDVGEYLYNIDRMMHQLKRSGKLEKLAGLIVGRFTDIKDTERPFGQTAYEIIRNLVKEYDYPVCYGFPVSHDNENYAMKIGFKCSLKVNMEHTRLEEIRRV